MIEITDEMIGVSKYAPKSNPNQQMEGWVIKNYDKLIMAKKVISKFKEDNAVAFGGIPKYEETDTGKICARYLTNARLDKAIFHFVELGDPLELSLMPKIVGYAYKDVWEENWKTIIKKYRDVNFKDMQKIIVKRAKAVLEQVIINNER